MDNLKQRTAYSPLLYVFAIIFMIGITSCEKDNEFSGEVADISVEIDTLTFDTVFTEVGSATRYFKVYNNESADIFVNVAIENPSKTKFRINVDGTSGKSIQNVRIPANDSIYVFADVTVDPDQPVSISPFVISENLQISSNGVSKNVLLEAWGQNANYIPGRKKNGLQSLLSCDFGQYVFDDPKPYVIYGLLLVDECELVLPAGTSVYVHGGIAKSGDNFYSDGLLLIGKNGRLTSRGTVDNPVIFQGDRLEEKYDAQRGQWAGIRILSESTKNSMKHTVVKNSIIGIRVDSMADLSLSSCIIKNTAADGLIGIHSNITASNTLIHDNGTQAATLVYGGVYNFDHCTLANYDGKKTTSLLMNNFFRYQVSPSEELVVAYPLEAYFRNTIIAGDDDDEIILQDATDDAEDFTYKLYNSIVRVKELIEPDAFPDFFDHCEGCIQQETRDTLFVNTTEGQGDYHLDTLSIAEQKAVPLPFVSTDLEGNMRDAVSPDIGCYEYQY